MSDCRRISARRVCFRMCDFLKPLTAMIGPAKRFWKQLDSVTSWEKLELLCAQYITQHPRAVEDNVARCPPQLMQAAALKWSLFRRMLIIPRVTVIRGLELQHLISWTGRRPKQILWFRRRSGREVRPRRRCSLTPRLHNQFVAAQMDKSS